MTNLKKTIVFLIYTTSLFFAIFYLKFQFSHKLTSEHTGLNGVLNSSEPIDNLLVGSSHTRMSYDMKEFCTETNTNSYAVAYNGLSYYFMYPLVKYLIEDSGKKINNLIIENYVVTASTAPILQDKNFYVTAPPALKKEILKKIAETEHGLSWRNFFELTVSSKNQDIIFSPITNHFLNMTYFRGTQYGIESGSISKAEFDDLSSPLEIADITIKEIQQRALTNILALLKKHKVHAIFVESPVPHLVEQDSTYKRNKFFLKNIIEENNFVYYDGATNFPTTDHNIFLDAGHLSTKGRKLFTQNLIEILAKQTR